MEEKFIKVVEEFKKATEKECYKVLLLEDAPSIMDDKIGGQPYLPIGEEYPKDKDGNYMPLLLQVNLKNVDLVNFPKKGILEIFTDKDVDYPCQYSIRYYEEGLEYQTDLPVVDTSRYIVEKAIKIKLEKDICHMTINDYKFADVMCKILNELFGENLKNYGEMEDYFGDFPWYDKIRDVLSNPAITIGGYPDFTQSDPRYDRLSGKDECLFKLDSWLNSKLFNIGDCGILFTLKSLEDLKNNKFENAVVDWDCC